MSLRRIEALPFPDAVTPDLGERPELLWVAPTDLWVDQNYQRDLKRQSFELIAKMRREFRWNRMKPPIVVRSEDKLHVIDGQHTAIVAATLKIPLLPVFIVSAEARDERARSFVSHNTDRVRVQPIDIFRALVSGGDPEALEVDQVLTRAKVRLRQISPSTLIAEGDSMAVGTIRNLVKKRGPLLARQVLETLVQAKRVPISAAEIIAAEQLLCLERGDRVDREALTLVIRMLGDEGLMAAQGHAKVSKKPVWRVLAERWRKQVDQALVA